MKKEVVLGLWHDLEEAKGAYGKALTDHAKSHSIKCPHCGSTDTTLESVGAGLDLVSVSCRSKDHRFTMSGREFVKQATENT